MLGRNEITVKNLNSFIPPIKNGCVLSVLSRIPIKEKLLHIPMMDFACKRSVKSEKAIEAFLKKIGHGGGVILFSGKGYHYYGLGLINNRSWMKFLGKCLLSGLIDERYIGHRLIDGCGILRLSASSVRPYVPIVVSVLSD